MVMVHMPLGVMQFLLREWIGQDFSRNFRVRAELDMDFVCHSIIEIPAELHSRANSRLRMSGIFSLIDIFVIFL